MRAWQGKRQAVAVAMVMASWLVAHAQDATPTASAPAAPAAQTPAAATVTAAAQGGTIKGIVVAGTPGKGGIPLPGVAITAKNSLTGKLYTTSTDVDGNYSMSIPKNGRYVIKAELAGFAADTHEVVLNGTDVATAKPADFGLTLASRAAAASAATGGTTTTASTAARGAQTLSLSGLNGDTEDVTSAGSASATTPEVPSMGGLGDAAGASDSVAVSGTQGQTNAMGRFSEDDIRQRVQDAIQQGQMAGMIPQGGDPTNAIMGALMPMMGGFGGPGMGGPGGGPGGGGPGGRGSRGGGSSGGGFGNFRSFNPAQPHGNVFWQGGNSALNASTWQESAPGVPHFITNPSAYSNNFGASIAGSPYIPGLTKPDTRQFVFLNLTGKKNLNAFEQAGRVPTALERLGDFTQSYQKVATAGGSTLVPVSVYNPATGTIENGCVVEPTGTVCGNNIIQTSSQNAKALALLNYFPLPNLATTDPTANNYQTISNAGSNSFAINSRYTRTIGQQTGNSPFGGFGGRSSRSSGSSRSQTNQKPTLRQNINIGYNYQHQAQDNRNIILPLGGATASTGNGLNVGYTISYGRLSNNASLNWNRSNSETRNYFTDTANNPSATVGLTVPNNTGGFADPRFYNGLAHVSISNFTGLSNASPSETINQTISFSDFVAWRRKGHNWRFGFDQRRVHADTIGGNNPLGSYTFTGYATSAPADQVAGLGGQTSGYALADFLLGLPQSTAIQAGLYKTYLRENVWDGYANDDWRVSGNLTLNYGLRYDYYGPYTEKNGHLVNLTLSGVSPTGITSIGCTSPNPVAYSNTVTCSANPNPSLVNADHTMFSPRFGFAWRPKFWPKVTKNWVARGGYGINYNTGQYSQFARNLAHQQPFSATQNNSVPVPTTSNSSPTATGCTTTQSAYTYTNAAGQTVMRPATTANMNLATSGFGCSTLTFNNNWVVDPNYKLGMVQVYNVNLQRTLPLGIVFNLGYNGTKASGLDVVGSPNANPTGLTTTNAAAFDYETTGATSHSNSLVVSLQKRQQKGIAVGATYTYSHTIDNASGVGGAVGTPVQNFFNLAAEYGNANYDQRHNLTGNFVAELPFGPNRAFLNKGGVMSHVLDGFSISGTTTIASGTYYTPTYSNSESEAAAAGTFIQRPNRVVGQSIKGAGRLTSWFNTTAFSAPAAGQYGTASQGSIEGPGTLSVSASLSRTIQFEGTNSFEMRATATNVFNTVQYSSINTNLSSSNFGQVTAAAAMRTIQVQARYRF